MNKSRPLPSKPPAMGVVSRRSLLTGALAGAGTLILWPGRARARGARLTVGVPNRTVGAIAAAVGGSAVAVSVRDALGPTSITIGDAEVPVGKGVLLKGEGAARLRYLDDARNGSKLAARIRDALIKADPAQREHFQQTHRAWSKTFTRKVLRWELALKNSPLRGKKIQDAHGRIYLLEWAGAVVTPRSKDRGPASLSKLPGEPTAPTPEAYMAYVDALVKAVS